jgi:hypothetical protein
MELKDILEMMIKMMSGSNAEKWGKIITKLFFEEDIE